MPSAMVPFSKLPKPESITVAKDRGTAYGYDVILTEECMEFCHRYATKMHEVSGCVNINHAMSGKKGEFVTCAVFMHLAEKLKSMKMKVIHHGFRSEYSYDEEHFKDDMMMVMGKREHVQFEIKTSACNDLENRRPGGLSCSFDSILIKMVYIFCLAPKENPNHVRIIGCATPNHLRRHCIIRHRGDIMSNKGGVIKERRLTDWSIRCRNMIPLTEGTVEDLKFRRYKKMDIKYNDIGGKVR